MNRLGAKQLYFFQVTAKTVVTSTSFTSNFLLCHVCYDIHCQICNHELKQRRCRGQVLRFAAGSSPCRWDMDEDESSFVDQLLRLHLFSERHRSSISHYSLDIALLACCLLLLAVEVSNPSSKSRDSRSRFHQLNINLYRLGPVYTVVLLLSAFSIELYQLCIYASMHGAWRIDGKALAQHEA